MKPLSFVPLALRSIQRSPGRSVLTALGVVIGVASVVVMVSIGQGARSAIDDQINNLGTNLVVVTPGASAGGGVSGGAGSMNKLTVADAAFIAREGQLVSAVSPVVTTRAVVVAGAENWRTSVLGVDASYDEIRSWSAPTGDFFTADDVKSARKVAVLGATVASNLFPGEDPVGQTVRIGAVPMRVVGVLAAKGQTAEGADQDDVVLAPYTTVQSRLSGRQFIAQMPVSAASKDDVPLALQEVHDLMAASHGSQSAADEDFTVRDQSQLAAAAQGTTNVMSALLGAVASVSLLVGGIGIMNIMLVSVTERTREIGIRRALGARQQDVLSQFLVESVVLSALGGLVGAGVGVGASLLVGTATGWATAVTPATLLVAMGFSGAVGAFFGWYPARRAASLDVIDALRHQ